MNNHYEIVVPLHIIVDITNNLYLFTRAADDLGGELGQQFKVGYRPQASGPWWRMFYWQGLHGAFRQTVAEVMTISSIEDNEQPPSLSRVDAARFLPYLDIVYEMLAIWRDTRIDPSIRKQHLVNMFPLEVGRIIAGDSAEVAKNQWYEERDPLSHSRSESFFAHLERCPLRAVRSPAIPLDQAICYWSWIDHILAQRTFCREDGARNLKLCRMEQAVTFCRLIDHIYNLTGRDLRFIRVPIDNSVRALLEPGSIEALARIVDTYDMTRTKDTIGLDISIKSDTLGAALRALLAYLLY